ncbi:MAG: RdgB/HAM1 family non-canonical purine NTP pyrophosphatase [Spirochaetaceae bacterium]|jgi:XTP/dITP diphosphohydrolase|nr:RdgB/HAM1 family non-canonical purine NTP pyrophosphatase [Spirochaetaceae bacterium]
MNIWFASGNKGKRKELAAILPQVKLRIPADAGIDFDPDETGTDFIENALIKARALYKLVKQPVIADDSGLCVDALGGRPGIYSARYGSKDGSRLDGAERNMLLLKEIGDASCRSARFVCAMAFLFNENRFFAVQETLEGEILYEPRGAGGFGYDPIVYLPEQKCSVAELSEELKNKLSHRAKAARLLARAIL